MVLPRSMRIKGYKSFDYIHKSGIRYNSSSLLLKVAKAKPNLIKSKIQGLDSKDSCRCAVSISNKVSKRAVIRNQVRRIFHEHLKLRLLNQSRFQRNWILISLRPSSLDKGVPNLLKEVDNLLYKASLSND